MQVEFESLEEQVRKVRVTFDVAEVREITDAEARKLAKQARIPGGYTKLKAKVARVKQISAFREQIFLRSMEGFVEKAAGEGLKELPFETIGRPEVDELPELKSFNQELTVEIMVEEKPRVEELRYKAEDHGIEYPPAPEVEVSNEDVDKALEEELDRLTRYEDADETVVLGLEDLALLHITIFEGDEARVIPGAESVSVVVGSKQERPPAFTAAVAQALIGTHKGDEGDLDFDWPEGDDQPEDVAGKTVRIHWLIHLARHRIRPELTDDFVKEITQGEETSVLAYRGLLREQLVKKKESEHEGAHLEKVVDVLIEANPFPMPERLLERSINERWDATKKNIEEGRKPEPEDMEAHEAEERELYRTEIIRELRKTLLVAQIMDTEGVKPDMEEINQQAQALMGSMGGMDPKDPQSQNFYMSVMTHLTNKDIESRVYRRIMGKYEAEEIEAEAVFDRPTDSEEPSDA